MCSHYMVLLILHNMISIDTIKVYQEFIQANVKMLFV